MNCREVERMIPDFLDGLLADTFYGEVREHVDHCESCRDALEHLGSFSNDIRRLGEVEPPFDLLSELSQGQVKRSSVSAKKKAPSLQGAVILGAAVALVIVLALFFLSRYLSSSNKRARIVVAPASSADSANDVENPVPAEIPADVPASGSDETESATDLRPSAWTVEHIQPFHWHLELEKPAAELETMIVRIAQRVDYRVPGFYIFTVTSERIPAYLDGLKPLLKAEEWESKARLLRTLPSSDHPLEFSVWVAQAEAPLHLDLKFVLPNQYGFKADLQDAEIQYQFEGPRLLVFEAGPVERMRLQKVIRETPALLISKGREAFERSQGVAGVRRIVLYLD